MSQRSKTLVEEDGKFYTMFIQKGLEDFFPKSIETTIRYYSIGYKNELYLTLVT